MNKIKTKLHHGNNNANGSNTNASNTSTLNNSSNNLNQDPVLQQNAFNSSSNLNQGSNLRLSNDPLLAEEIARSSQNFNQNQSFANNVVSTREEQVILPTVVETVERVDVVNEIQPVVHRVIEQPTIHHVEQHVYEAAPSASGSVQLQPIIQETIVPKVVNEIQEVIHREVPVVQVNRVEEHVTENIVLPTVYTKEVIQGTSRQYVSAGGPAYVTPAGASFQQGGINSQIGNAGQQTAFIPVGVAGTSGVNTMQGPGIGNGLGTNVGLGSNTMNATTY